MLLLVTLFAVTIGSSLAGPGRWNDAAEPDCSQLPNGPVYVGGCGSFGVCQNGNFAQVDCTNGTVVHTQSLQCTNPGNALFPCNLPPADCLPHAEHPGYRVPLPQPDPDQQRPACSIYYTCSYGNFLPYQWCPEGTVYDELNQRCNDPIIVAPPCGTGPATSGVTPNPFGQNQGQNQNGGGPFQNQYGTGQGGQPSGGGQYPNQYGNGQNQFGPNRQTQNGVADNVQSLNQSPFARSVTTRRSWSDGAPGRSAAKNLFRSPGRI